VRGAVSLAAAVMGVLTGTPSLAHGHAQAEHRRYIISLVEPSDDLKTTRKRVHRVAGVHVDSLKALSPTQVVVVLRCPSAARCDAALSRLAAASSWVRGVDVDALRTSPAPVAASAAR
jgi:hypothetical protein